MRIAFTLLIGLLTFPSAYADIIFSNFADSDSFDLNTGLTVADSSGNNLKTSLSFTPSDSFQLSQIDFVTSLLNANDQNQVTLTLSESDADGNPGTVVEVFSFSGQMGVLGSTTSPPLILNAISALNPVLQGGVQYWITAESSTDVTVVWNQNVLSPNDVGTMAQFRMSSWTTQSVTRGAFRMLAALSRFPLRPSLLTPIRQGNLTNYVTFAFGSTCLNCGCSTSYDYQFHN